MWHLAYIGITSIRKCHKTKTFCSVTVFVHRHYLYLLSNEDDNYDDNEDEIEDNLIKGVRKKRGRLKRKQNTAELAANTEANPTCTNLKKIFSGRYVFLMQAKEYRFVLRNFLLLEEQKKWKRPYLCQLFKYARPMSTLIEPN